MIAWDGIDSSVKRIARIPGGGISVYPNWKMMEWDDCMGRKGECSLNQIIVIRFKRPD